MNRASIVSIRRICRGAVFLALWQAGACQTQELPDRMGVLLLPLFDRPGARSIPADAAYKKVFFTAAKFAGSLGGIVGADSRCLNDANHPGRGTYRAMLADDAGVRRACTSAGCATDGSAENIDWAFAPSTTYVQADTGNLIGTTGPAGIFALATGQTLTNPPASSTVQYWTGLNGSWQSTNSCAAWNSPSAGNTGSIGSSAFADSRMIFTGGLVGCDIVQSLLCVEQ